MRDWSDVLKSTVAFSPLSSRPRYSAGLRSRIPASYCRPWWTCLESSYRYLCKCWVIFYNFLIVILIELVNLYSDGRCELFLNGVNCEHVSGCIRTVTYKIGQTITVQGAVDSGSMSLAANHAPIGHNLLQSLNEVLATYTFSTFACCFHIHWTRSLFESLLNLNPHKSKFESHTNQLAAGSVTGTVIMHNCIAGTLSKVDLLKSMSIIALSKRHACLEGNALQKMGIEKLWKQSCKETFIYSALLNHCRRV